MRFQKCVMSDIAHTHTHMMTFAMIFVVKKIFIKDC